MINKALSLIYEAFLTDFVDSYLKKARGENCQEDQVIVTESECKVAATTLKIQYKWANTGAQYPAGCYWIHGYSDVFFNTVIDLSKTDPSQFGSRAGVCLNKNRKF